MSIAKTDSQILQRFSNKWETKQLGEIGEISGAGVDKKINPNEVPVRLVNYLDVYNKTFLYSKDLTHEVSARPDQVRHCVVEQGDIFFTPSSEVPDDIGCSAVAMEDISDGVYSYHVVRLRLKTNWDLYFRAYAFDTKAFLDQASKQCEGSGTRYVISLPKFRAMTVRFPPTVEEQRAIAEVLSDVDGLLNALEALVAKKRMIKQAVMQQLLTGKTRLPGFNGAWETKRVSEFGNVVTGATPRTKVNAFWDGPYPWITPTDITSERDMTISERMITQEGLNSIRTLPPNTVLITCIASIGKNAILKTTGSCNQQINAVVPNAAHNAEFLYYLFEYSSNYLLTNAGVTATPIISKSIFSEFIFQVPSLEEQRSIASVLSDMDSEIAALEKRRDKTCAIKRGMMQLLLTGQIRLIKTQHRD